MNANTEMARLDSLPAATLEELFRLAANADDLLALEGLPAVSSTSNGKVLGVDSGKWKAVNPTLAGDTDVAISSPSNGQVLAYDGEAGKWKNASGGGATVSLVGYTYDEATETDTMNKTWQEVHDLSVLGPVFLHDASEQSAGNNIITSVEQSSVSEWSVYVGAGSDWVFTTDSVDGYPSYTGGGGDT